MQIRDAILQSEDFISLLHQTIWISEFILFHVQDIAKRFFLLPLSAASKMWYRIISPGIRETTQKAVVWLYDKYL